MTGGMRSITFVQAFQYWLKLTALAVPVVFILLVLTGSGIHPPAAARPSTRRRTSPVMHRCTGTSR